MVIETMLEEKLGYRETARRFQVCNLTEFNNGSKFT